MDGTSEFPDDEFDGTRYSFHVSADGRWILITYKYPDTITEQIIANSLTNNNPMFL